MYRLAKLIGGILFSTLLICGCGGSGGTTGRQTSAVLKISTTGTLPAGGALSGVGVSITLPAGVTVPTDAQGLVNAGVVVPSGVAATGAIGTTSFRPATATVPAQLQFVVVDSTPDGFGVGEFATVNVQVAVENGVRPGDFVLSSNDLQPADLQLQPVTGLGADCSAVIR